MTDAPPERILARYGELWLKGKNRRAFEGALIRNLRAACADDGTLPADVLAALSRNPAQSLRLRSKGRIEAGADADGSPPPSRRPRSPFRRERTRFSR